jgi:hypothetical protein
VGILLPTNNKKVFSILSNKRHQSAKHFHIPYHLKSHMYFCDGREVVVVFLDILVFEMLDWLQEEDLKIQVSQRDHETPKMHDPLR